jgi:peptide deformylase
MKKQKETNKNCPCGSGLHYTLCCQRLHKGGVAQNALELMRSRFSAYVLNIPNYIIKTTHPASPQYDDDIAEWRREISDFSKTSHFDKLEILDFKENGIIATVTFIAHMRRKETDATCTEKSYFEKANGVWFYRSGKLSQGYAPNLITTDQMRLLPLAYYGNSVLRNKALPIQEITEDLKKLIEEMKETMDACNGLGLAAPQVHHSIQLFLIRAPIEMLNGDLEPGELQIFINPSLSDPSEDTWTVSEGCLSIPTIYCDVERPKEITVEYTNLENKSIKKRVSGWEARAIMHEYDHLQGIFFIDHVEKEERQEITSHLNNLEKRIRGKIAL